MDDNKQTDTPGNHLSTLQDWCESKRQTALTTVDTLPLIPIRQEDQKALATLLLEMVNKRTDIGGSEVEVVSIVKQRLQALLAFQLVICLPEMPESEN